MIIALDMTTRLRARDMIWKRSRDTIITCLGQLSQESHLPCVSTPHHASAGPRRSLSGNERVGREGHVHDEELKIGTSAERANGRLGPKRVCAYSWPTSRRRMSMARSASRGPSDVETAIHSGPRLPTTSRGSTPQASRPRSIASEALRRAGCSGQSATARLASPIIRLAWPDRSKLSARPL